MREREREHMKDRGRKREIIQRYREEERNKHNEK